MELTELLQILDGIAAKLEQILEHLESSGGNETTYR